MSTVVAIIGRANVGKSTLFNRLSGERKAMVFDTPGTTRDLKYNSINWQGKKFELIDTGGFLSVNKTPLKNLTKKEQKKLQREAVNDLDKQVERQARLALKKSKIVLFVVDVREGLNPRDKEVANYLRKQGKKIILVANKCDNIKYRQESIEFIKLGFGEPLSVSALSGSGSGDILDEIIKNIDIRGLDIENKNTEVKNPIKVSIVGKPNAGKSSLLNSLLGENKYIVSATPHTTREPNDTLIKFKDRNILLIDTAGIRRKAKIKRGSLEKLGVRMSIGTLKKSDTVLFVIDVNEAISHQDLQLGKIIAEAGSGIIIVANKYDVVKNKTEGDTKSLTKELSDYIYQSLPHLSFAPIIFTSALTGFNVKKILNLILNIEEERKIRIPDSALSRFLKTLIAKQPPPRKKIGFGSRTKIKRAFITNFKQIDIDPPTFECTIGSKEKLPEEYRRYLINSLRSKFGFKGTMIKLVVRYKKTLE